MEKRNNYFYNTGRKEMPIPEFSRIPTSEYIFMVDKEIVAKLEYGTHKNRQYTILRYGINKSIVNFTLTSKDFKTSVSGLFRYSTYSLTQDYINKVYSAIDNDTNPYNVVIGLRIIIDFLRYLNIRKEIVIYEYTHGGLLKLHSNDIRSL